MVDEAGCVGCIDYYKDVDQDKFGVDGDKKCLEKQQFPYTALIGGDCNDNDPNIHPGVQEVCNNKDDDCNGEIDEEGSKDCKVFYKDADGDGFGVEGDTQCLCVGVKSYTATKPGDCDDTDKQINPTQSEKCGNQKDDNCNGYIDEEGAVGCSTYYEDKDGDGFGSLSSKCLCAPSGFYKVTKSGDCDDNNKDVNPQGIERCDNIDNNCNNLVDEGENLPDCSKYYYDQDGDGYGTENSKCLCAPSNMFRATKAGDCNDNNSQVYPDAKEQCDNIDNNCNGQIDEKDAYGCTTYYEDKDGDGYGTANSLCLCKSSAPYVATKTGDCADDDPSVSPAKNEICNNKDDNCNKEIDEGEGLSGCIQYWYDNDGDGYGIGSLKCLCKPKDKYSALSGGDCNDNNKDVNPNMKEKCDNLDNNCNNQIDEGQNNEGCIKYYEDKDSDGYGTDLSQCLCSPSGVYKATKTGDCNDTTSSAYPGANEKCDNIDNNCDGVIDEEGSVGCTTYYEDNDGDGYGGSKNKCLCKSSPPYSATKGGDCNDSNKEVYPSATEKCDNVDNDCDGQTDEDLNAPGCTWYYYDGDGDGFGIGSSKCYCKPTDKYTALQSGDCNDSNPEAYPYAPEKCDKVDNNCNGSIDEGQNLPGCKTYYYDGDMDGFGTSSQQCLCNPTGSYSAEKSGDCNDSNKNINPSASETCNSIDDNCNGSIDEGFESEDYFDGNQNIDFSNSWPGQKITDCLENTCQGTIYGRLLPKGDIDWFRFYKKEMKAETSNITGKLTFKGVFPKYYKIYACWSKSDTTKCDKSQEQCSTSQIGNQVTLTIINTDTQEDDSAYLDVKIEPQDVNNDFSSDKWSLSWQTYE